MSNDKDDIFGGDSEFEALNDADFFGNDDGAVATADEPAGTEENAAEVNAETRKVRRPSSMPQEPKAETPAPTAPSQEAVDQERAAENLHIEKEEAAKKVEAEAKKQAAAAKVAVKAKADKPARVGKNPRKLLTPLQKEMNKALKKAGVTELPELAHLMRGKQGTKMKISDIAVFIEEPEDEVLKHLFSKMSKLNRVNLSATVEMRRILYVGAQILLHGRMFQPIQIANIDGDGTLECTSGRHRVAFLALAYGPDSEIPVYIEKMNLNEARDAVVVANQSRKAKAMEKAEHLVLQSVGGDVDAEQDDIYSKMVINKMTAKKYCTFSVMERGYPELMTFDVTNESTRKNGELTTVTSMEGFWGYALNWSKDMSREDFDAGLQESIKFLNKLAANFVTNGSFDPTQHMAAKTLEAIGKYFRTLANANTDIDDALIKHLSDVVVAMADIGRNKSEKTYMAIVQAMKR